MNIRIATILFLSTMAHCVHGTSSTTSDQNEPATRRGLGISLTSGNRNWVRVPVCVPYKDNFLPVEIWDTQYLWSWDVGTFLTNNPHAVKGECAPQCKTLCSRSRKPCMEDNSYVTESGRCLCDLDHVKPKKCLANAVCNVTTDQCECITGFRTNEVTGTCEDINECESATTGLCPQNSVCVNTVGSSTCECNPGYTPLDGSCVDIDECATTDPLYACSSHATCTNTAGSAICTCKAPYFGDGWTCMQVVIP